MIYRTHVAVLLAIPNEFLSSIIPESERTDWDAVGYTFGINASDTSEAVSIAVAAARNAVDRDGKYIGGVVVEALCQYANREEFNGYEKYFHNPIDKKGIFYVSGVTSYPISKERVVDADVELEKEKENIKHYGVPAPSFVHPKLPKEPPTKVRMLCSVCGHWIEVSNFGLIYCYYGGLDRFSPADQEAIKAEGRDQEFIRARDVAGPFMQRHWSQCAGKIFGIQEDDERWNTLSGEFREDV